MSKRRKMKNDSDSDNDSVTAEYGSPDNKDNTMPRPKSLSNDELSELKKQDEYNKLSGVTKRYPKTKNTLYARQFTPVGLHDKSPRGDFNRFFEQRYKINDPELYEAFQGIPPPEERLLLPPTMDSIIRREKSYSTNKALGNKREKKKSNFFPNVKIGGRRTRRRRRKKRTRRRKSRRKRGGTLIVDGVDIALNPFDINNLNQNVIGKYFRFKTRSNTGVVSRDIDGRLIGFTPDGRPSFMTVQFPGGQLIVGWQQFVQIWMYKADTDAEKYILEFLIGSPQQAGRRRKKRTRRRKSRRRMRGKRKGKLRRKK